MAGAKLIFSLFLLIAVDSFARVTLPKLISDGMVLQRDARVNIWGWAAKGEKVTATIAKKSFRAVASADGKWKIVLPAMKAGGPYEMTIKGNENAITVKDILFGDVWVCSGQSNMVLTMERVKEKYPEEITSANYPAIRNFLVPTYSDVTRVYDDLPSGKWVVTSPETVFGFGAVAYFFAKNIYEKHKVPVGIINSSVGGTPAEAWVSEEGLREFQDFTAMIRNFKDTTFMSNIRRSNLPVSRATYPDKGLEGKWFLPETNVSEWRDFWLPGYWDDQGVKNLHGILWFRKDVNVPDSLAGKPAKLFMGRIIDADEVFVNGTKVGNITYQYPPRRYPLPDGLLKAGKNSVVVRVTNTWGKGGFVPDKPYHILIGKTRIDLRGEWKCQVGSVFPREEGSQALRFSAQDSPTGLYNTMVAPLINYSIRGFNWYQGEANTGSPGNYSKILTALIRDWRRQWGQGDLPFAFVQLANFMEVQFLPVESNWARLRDEQRKSLANPNTAMAVAIDAGEWNDIHPLNKKAVGERLALCMEHLAYQDNRIVYSGPLYQAIARDGAKLVLTFSNIGGGLVARGGGDLCYFEVAGADGKYVKAKAVIEGEKVVVWNENVTDPVSVRYAWADNPEGSNLYNKEGLPASPFEAALDGPLRPKD